ncbi:PREDICTED: uncharacterized protein LOC106321631 [Brassica oleracea var. oleracea]|uniref:uncharacterized protein LOC106321631 n=1 Tax=Brassica oleracea var. oleracea TaxID=109376 RepID=UPI0006A6DDFE|nr:PREDICTED: uncharacterized protein LOC106321631 [Brassica oleracea var. oleracea]
MRHHLIEGLKDQYMTIENPLDLWNALKHRYDHQKMVLLPKARHDWMHLIFMDFKSVDEYNSALFKIVSILRLCGEEVSDVMMLEKTYTTFNQSNSVLQQQYRTKGFATYTDLMSCLLLAEANNELLMKNSGARPAGTAPLPEAHDIEKKDPKEIKKLTTPKTTGNHTVKAVVGTEGVDVTTIMVEIATQPAEGETTITVVVVPITVGAEGVMAVDENCRTPKHLCELYQESIKNKNPEANMIQENGHDDKGYGYDADDETDSDNKDDQMDFETSDCLKD